MGKVIEPNTYTEHRPQPRYRRKVSRSFVDHPSMTEQAHKDDVDINRIMKKYEKTGVLEHVNQHQGTYGDYTGTPDFQTAQNMIAEANSMFESLPAKIRSDMDNDPVKFVDFMQNPDNREAMTAYGLTTDHLPDVPADPAPTPTQEPETPPEA